MHAFKNVISKYTNPSSKTSVNVNLKLGTKVIMVALLMVQEDAQKLLEF